MGFIRSFKANRALPPTYDPHRKGFELNRFPAMRKIPVEIHAPVLSPAFLPFVKLFVPANAWADQHELFMRVQYSWADGGAPPPPGVNIQERVSFTAPGTPVVFNEGAPAAAIGTGWFEIVRRFLRRAGEIYYFDEDDTSGWIGIGQKPNGTSGLQIIRAAGAWDFSQPIDITWDVKNAGPPWAVGLQVYACTAFVQAPLNLRTI